MGARTTLQGTLLVLLSALMFGSYGIWSRLMGDSFGAFYQGWTRALIIIVLLLPFLIAKKAIVPIDRSDWKWMTIFLLFTSLTQAPLYYAFNNMDVGSATLLFFSAMLFTMYFFGFVFYKEKLTPVKVIAFLLACCGIALTYSFAFGAFALFAGLMAITNGIASGGEVASSKTLSDKYSPLYLTALSWLIILVTNAPVSILLGETQPLPTLTMPWLYQLGYTACGLIDFWAVIAGFKYLDASIGGLIGLLEIVFSLALGYLIFSQVPSAQTLIGGGLILIAAALPHISDLVLSRKHQS